MTFASQTSLPHLPILINRSERREKSNVLFLFFLSFLSESSVPTTFRKPCSAIFCRRPSPSRPAPIPLPLLRRALLIWFFHYFLALFFL